VSAFFSIFAFIHAVNSTITTQKSNNNNNNINKR